MRKSLMILAAAPILLAACATRPQPLYYWGNFQEQQHAYFKGEKGAEQEILDLEKIREEAKAKGKSVPPGLQAHLAMLYGATGRSDLFVENLEAERRQFPESSTFMDFLLKKPAKQ